MLKMVLLSLLTTLVAHAADEKAPTARKPAQAMTKAIPSTNVAQIGQQLEGEMDKVKPDPENRDTAEAQYELTKKAIVYVRRALSTRGLGTADYLEIARIIIRNDAYDQSHELGAAVTKLYNRFESKLDPAFAQLEATQAFSKQEIMSAQIGFGIADGNRKLGNGATGQTN